MQRQVHSVPEIRKLDAITADQIAAGEVVERPGSALKELLENSLDAGATKINIRVRGGGKDLLEVNDNGFGISYEQLPLALDRHATSKIRKSADIHDVASFGFRGEALAAISAVSRLSISSRTANMDAGRELVCEAGKISIDREIGRNIGTSVRMESLFYNTPVREKFLKSPASESNFCLQTIYKIAISNPQCAFEYHQDDKKVFYLNQVEAAEERIAQVITLRSKIDLRSEELIYFSREKEDTKLYGYMLPMKHCLPTSKGIYTFVNGRSVKDKLLQQAIMSATKEVMFGREYPQIVLFLETSANNVDVNVHPTKAEVRFRDSGRYFGLIRKTLTEKLTELRLPNINSNHFNLASPSFASSDSPIISHEILSNSFGLRDPHQEEKITEPAPSEDLRIETSTSLFETATNFQQKNSSIAAQMNTIGPQYICSLKNTYLLCQTDTGLLLIDQHAAHERIVYEKLKQINLSKGTQTAKLLIPIIVEVTKNAMELLEPNFTAISNTGLVLESFGPTQIKILELPDLLLKKDGSTRISLKKLIDHLSSEIEDDCEQERLPEIVQTAMLETVASQSCHGSVRAGQSLSASEANALIMQMSETDFSGHCPHGRPTSTELDWQQIEKLFKRKL